MDKPESVEMETEKTEILSGKGDGSSATENQKSEGLAEKTKDHTSADDEKPKRRKRGPHITPPKKKQTKKSKEDHTSAAPEPTEKHDDEERKQKKRRNKKFAAVRMVNLTTYIKRVSKNVGKKRGTKIKISASGLSVLNSFAVDFIDKVMACSRLLLEGEPAFTISSVTVLWSCNIVFIRNPSLCKQLFERGREAIKRYQASIDQEKTKDDTKQKESGRKKNEKVAVEQHTDRIVV